MRDDLLKSIERMGRMHLFQNNTEVRFTFFMVSNLLDVFEKALFNRLGDDPVTGIIMSSVIEQLEDDYSKADKLLEEFGEFLPRPSRN